MSKSKKPLSLVSIVLPILYILSAIAIVYALYHGLDYYLTSFTLRIRHADYKVLKPGGFLSHGFGILGSLFLVSLLVYSLRKRVRFFHNFGNLSNWLRVHIFFGLVGPMFIILHSTFKLNGLIAVSFWSMIAVALSGILGRYLYTQIPRNIQGSELSLKEVESERTALSQKLSEHFSVAEQDMLRVERLIARKRNTLLSSIWSDLARPWRHRKAKKLLRKKYQIKHSQIKILIHTAQEKVILERRIQLWSRVHNLFHYWHVFHKPFAVIMYIIMCIHIAIVVWLGYTWVY